jgi:quinol monooxygenase YgiN
MVNVVFALLATVAALIGNGLLVSRTLNQRLPHLVAWCLSMFGLCVALAAMTIGFLTGFGALLFRIMELGAALVAPVWLVLGVVELIAYYVQVRFAAWLFAVSYSIVAAVIVLLDPIEGTFGDALPKPDDHYTWLPLSLLGGAHVFVVIALVACAGVTALRARNQDGEAYEVLLPVALVTLAGVLLVAGTRGLLPDFLAIVALGAAAGLIWFGAMRTVPVEGAEQDELDEEDDYMLQQHRPEPVPERSFMAAPTAAMPPDGYPEPPERQGVPAGGVGLMGQEPVAAPPPSALYGQITVYTLLDGREEAFDRLAAEAVRAAREAEPDTLVYICHEVVNSPTQRIFYQLFRDQAAYQEHQNLPQVQRFLTDSRTHVLAVNVVELKLNGAKVVPLPSLSAQDFR